MITWRAVAMLWQGRATSNVQVQNDEQKLKRVLGGVYLLLWGDLPYCDDDDDGRKDCTYRKMKKGQTHTRPTILSEYSN